MTLLRWSGPIGLSLALGAGCGGPSLRGAIPIEDSREFAGAARAELVPKNCRDGRGAPTEPPALRVQRVLLSDGREALLELRPGYDAVLITNAHDDARGRVFQYVSDDGHQGKILHVLRMTPTLPGPRLELTDSFEAPGSGADFRATTQRPTLGCDLALPAPVAEPASGVTAPPPAGSR